MNRRQFLQRNGQWLAAAGCLGLAGCPAYFYSLEVESFGVDDAHPALGQTVRLSWSYSYDDPEVQAHSPGNRVRAQRLIFQRLHLIGIAEEAIQPNQVLPNGVVFNENVRHLTFTFNGPVTVRIEASFYESTEPDGADFHPIASAMLNVRLQQDLFCRARFSALDGSSVEYPYLGYPQGSDRVYLTESEVEFTQFVAFHDAGVPGQMDLAAQLPQVFAADRPFRALSFSAQEAEGFRTISGSAYPPQVFSQPQAGQTNAMLFAGAIVFGGEPIEDIKSDQDPESDARRSFINSGGQVGSPIFVSVPMLYGERTGSFIVADIHAGGIPEQLQPAFGVPPLVVTAISTPGQLAAGGIGTVNTLGLQPSGTGNLHVGNIKGATLVHDVTTVDGDIFTTSVGVDLDWQCQFLPDDELDQVLSLGAG